MVRWPSNIEDAVTDYVMDISRSSVIQVSRGFDRLTTSANLRLDASNRSSNSNRSFFASITNCTLFSFYDSAIWAMVISGLCLRSRYVNCTLLVGVQQASACRSANDRVAFQLKKANIQLKLQNQAGLWSTLEGSSSTSWTVPTLIIKP